MLHFPLGFSVGMTVAVCWGFYYNPELICAASSLALAVSNSALLNVSEVSAGSLLESDAELAVRRDIVFDTTDKTVPGDVEVRISVADASPTCQNTSATSIVRLACPPGRRLGLVVDYGTFMPPLTHTTSQCLDQLRTIDGINFDANGSPYFTISSGLWNDGATLSSTDRQVGYNCSLYGPPVPAYYADTFLPKLGVFDTTVTPPRLIKNADVDFVVWEVNSRNTFGYDLTVAGANCHGAPQSWTQYQQLATSSGSRPDDLWSKSSHVSCNDSAAPALTDTIRTSSYQILSDQNGIDWQSRVMGVYMFRARVVDSEFRYIICLYYCVYLMMQFLRFECPFCRAGIWSAHQ
jgi:hypothetical protein